MKHIVTAENAPRILEWMKTRGGIKVWKSLDLSDPGASWTTPADRDDKPSWKAEADRVITDPTEVIVVEYEVVKRFHVAVEPGDFLKINVTAGGSRRIRRELTLAGEGSTYSFDYDAWENAVISKPVREITLAEWKPR